MIEMEWVEPIISLVTTGGFGGLLWYIVVKHIPAMEERHKAERRELHEYLVKRDMQVVDITNKYYEAVSEFRAAIARALGDAQADA